jgi:hypothetical protein
MEAAYTAGSLVLQYYIQTSMKHSDQHDYRIDGAHGFHEVGPPLDQPLIWNTKQWTMAMPVDRTLPKACMCHISLVVMAGRHVAGAVDGRHHRLHPYHTIYPPSHPRCFRYLPRPRRDRLVLPPLQRCTHTHGCLAWSQLDNYGRSRAD